MSNGNVSDLASLPPEILRNIFRYIETKTLMRISSTCRSFKNVLHEDLFWRGRSTDVLGCNLVSPFMQRRSTVNLGYRERIIVGQKWKCGSYDRRLIVQYDRCMPCIQMDSRHLFVSIKNSLLTFDRKPSTGAISYGRPHTITVPGDDIVKFAINDSELVSVCCDGKFYRWKITDRLKNTFFRKEKCLFTAVDAKNFVIVTGTRDGTISVWNANEPSVTSLRKSINLATRVLSVALMPSSSKFSIGLRGIDGIHPLQLYDTETTRLISLCGEEFRYGAGIMCTYPESENTFLSSGYDTTIRLWDIRDTRKCVSVWEDPFDNCVSCVTSDHHVTMLGGSNRSGMTIVWDKRQSNIVRYHCETLQRSSPVYSIAFDATQNFAAFETGVYQYSYFR